jgi:bifunctional non-homologous end joining protein LigD
MSEEKRTTLYFEDEVSDKEYTAELVPAGNNLFNVNTFWGRRGSATQSGSKTPKGPVSYAAAEKLFNKVLDEKRSKGYAEGATASPQYSRTQMQAGVTQQGVSQAMSLPVVPGKLHPAPLSPVEARKLLANPMYFAQPKYDGVFGRYVYRPGQFPLATSKTNKMLSVPQGVVEDFGKINAPLIVDGEMVDGVLIVFDILLHKDIEIWKQSAEQRALYLKALFLHRYESILGTDSAFDTTQKNLMHDFTHSNGMEGMIFKLKERGYAPGKLPASRAVAFKWKYKNSCSFICGGQGDPSVRSVEAMLYDEAGQLCNRGSVTIPSNRQIPALNEICEAEYLYIHQKGGNLFQPVYKGVRSDVLPEECNVDQLFVKGDERG